MAANFIMIISFTLLVMETFIGMVANGFIVLMNYINWFKSRKLSPNDLILTCLGLSRLAWQAVVILDATMDFFFLNSHIWNYMFFPLYTMWIFTTTTSAWFAAWLSVFYFVFSHPVFLQLKQTFSELVSWLLFGSVVLSAILAITIVTSLGHGLSLCNSHNSLLSRNDSEIKMPHFCWYFDILVVAPNSIPFLIFLSSSILLITSLWKHIRRVQHNGIGVTDLNTQVHLTAIKVLASFAILYLSSFLALISQAILIWNNLDHTWLLIPFSNLITAYPSGHAIILILVNPKLKQALVKMLYHLKCCWSEVQS